MQVDLDEAGSRLSELISAAEAGEEVIVARNGVPVVRLVPITVVHAPVRLGSLAGQITIGEDFDDPLPELRLS